MIGKHKINKISEIDILKICVKTCLKEMSRFIYVAIFIIVAILTKKFLASAIENTLFDFNKLKDTSAGVRNVFIYNIFLTALNSSIQFILYNFTSTFRSRVSVSAIETILESESPEYANIINSSSQYHISRGATAFSNIMEILVVDIFGTLIFITVDLYRIYFRYGIQYFYIGLVSLATGTIIHYKSICLALKHKNILNESKIEMDRNIGEIISNYEIIKSYQGERSQKRTYISKVEPWKTSFMGQIKITIATGFIHRFLFESASFFVGITLSKYSNASALDIRNMYTLIANYELEVRNISNIYEKLRSSTLNAKLILRYLGNLKDGVKKGKEIQHINSNLRLENLEYCIGGKQIINKINLKINKGDKIALYGENGAGKSTLLKILLGLKKKTSGNIYIDDNSIDDISMESYRKLFSYIPQDTTLFDDTIFNNLIYGTGRSYLDVVKGCKEFNIHEDIMKLPEGYNTFVGDQGKKINGGLKQKIFCIRAFLKNSEVYLFDEPTANLDLKSSEKLLDVINSTGYGDKIFMIVCHTKDIVKRFKKVLIFEKNNVKYISS